MKNSVVILIAIFVIANFSCKKNLSVNKAEQYSFLQWYVAYEHIDSLKMQIIDLENTPIKLKDVYVDDLYKEGFTEKDKNFIETQRNENRDISLFDSLQLRDVNWITRKQEYTTYLSLPVFSLNKRIALIARIMHRGLLGGDAGIFVFKKTDEGWVNLELPIPHVIE